MIVSIAGGNAMIFCCFSDTQTINGQETMRIILYANLPSPSSSKMTYIPRAQVSGAL